MGVGHASRGVLSFSCEGNIYQGLLWLVVLDCTDRTRPHEVTIQSSDFAFSGVRGMQISASCIRRGRLAGLRDADLPCYWHAYL